ncbi:MAG: hypothetical protein AAF673_03220, partial [Pseudomonadota bacterium]
MTFFIKNVQLNFKFQILPIAHIFGYLQNTSGQLVPLQTLHLRGPAELEKLAICSKLIFPRLSNYKFELSKAILSNLYKYDLISSRSLP